MYMEIKFGERKKDFEQILELMKIIKKLSVKTKKAIGKINDLYIGLTEKTNDPVELFGLDFFNFQYEIYCRQYDDQMNLMNFLNNRIYGDYYKLYKLILMYVKNSVSSESLKAIVESNSNLPKYDKLDDKVVYPEEVLKTINSFVINVLEQIHNYYKEKMTNMNSKVKLSKKGFCIGNFVTTVRHKNEMIKHQVELYEGYVKFFNENHIKQMNQVKDRLEKIYQEISNDVNFTGDVDLSDDEDSDNEGENKSEYSEITTSIQEQEPDYSKNSTEFSYKNEIVSTRTPIHVSEVIQHELELKPLEVPSLTSLKPNECQEDNCHKKPYFNFTGESYGKYCADCKKEGMIYIKKV